MKKIIFGLLLLPLIACHHEDVKEDDNLKNPQWNYSSIGKFTERSSHSEDYYLATGFNLLRYPINNDKGFTFSEIVNLEQEAWSPFGAKTTNLKPKLKILDKQNYIEKFHQGLSDQSIYSKIILKANDNRTFELLAKSEYLQNISSDSYCSQTFIQNIQKEVSLEHFTAEVMSSYLSKDFVRDLKLLSAKELVRKYGTHLVGKYSLGAFLNFKLITDKKVFTEAETSFLEKALCSKENLLARNPKLEEKLYKYWSSVAVDYSSIGSKYYNAGAIHSLLNINDLALARLNLSKFKHGVIPNANAFLSLDRHSDGLIAIPDLITNTALKIKFLAGILEQYEKNIDSEYRSNIHYILCDKEGKPVKFDNQYLSTPLSKYDNTYSYIKCGKAKKLTGAIIKGNKSNEELWEMRLNKDGYWLILSKDTKQATYLCQDFKLRTEGQDLNNLRYWLLNPIIPTEKRGSHLDVERRFIK